MKTVISDTASTAHDCSASVRCVQYTPVKPVHTISDATLPHGALYRPLFYEQTSGSPDASVSQAECGSSGSHTWNGYPIGCFLNSDTLYYNLASTTTECSASNKCIQKNPVTYYEKSSGSPDLSMSESECQVYATSVGDSDGLGQVSLAYPAGCFKRTSGYFYGSGTDGTLCTTTNACIQKQIPDPDYVSLEECEAYASIIAVNTNTPQSYGNIRPLGCFDASGGYIYFNTVASSTYTCSTSYPCIKKNLQRDLRYVT